MIENPFDAPIPGQSLTDTPGNAKWEHPPQFTDLYEASEYVWELMHDEKQLDQIISFLDNDVPVEAVARMILFGGFMEGKWTPDVAFIIAEPVMKMIATMGMKAGVKNIRMSMEDITNKSEIQSIVRTKLSNEDAKKAAMGVKKDIKKVEQKGLMAKPKKEEMA